MVDVLIRLYNKSIVFGGVFLLLLCLFLMLNMEIIFSVFSSCSIHYYDHRHRDIATATAAAISSTNFQDY